jgi:hypothetical protein
MNPAHRREVFDTALHTVRPRLTAEGAPLGADVTGCS